MRRLALALACGAALSWLAHGCARQQYPPGGGEDRIPPAVVSTTPDTFQMIEPGLREIRIRFSERISERPTSGTLDAAVQVSPRTGEVRVGHDRSGLNVELLDGARPGTVYRVTVLPVIEDMFDNSMPEAFEFFFSTGPAFSPNVIAGTVRDRITGEAVEGARVDAVESGAGADAAPHTAVADSGGIFALRYVPPGRYRVQAYEDVNRNAELDPGFEASASDTARVAGADTLLLSLAVLAPDTTAPVLGSAEAVDSAAVRLTFDDHLDPAWDPEEVRVTLAVVEGETEGAPGAREILLEHEWEARREEAPDTAEGAGPGGAPAGRGEAETPGGLRLPSRTLYVLLAGNLEEETIYEVTATGVENIQGTGGGGGSVEFLYAPPEPVVAPGDTTAVGDTAAVPDTAVVPDTSAAPDTAAVPDTSAAPDTSGVPDTTTVPDTSATPTPIPLVPDRSGAP